jgi:hypothetical protein
MNKRWLSILVVAMAPIYGAAGQEPPRDRPPGPPDEAQAPLTPEQERAALKARLERRLSESKQNQERLESAIKKLDAGEPLENVRDASPGPGRERPGSRDGPMRRPMGPDFMGERNSPRREGGRPEGPGGSGEPGAPGGPGDREPVLRMLERANPELYERFMEVRRESPERAEQMLARIEPHMRELIAERDPEMLRLRIQTMRNGWELMGASRRLGELVRGGGDAAEVQEAQERIRALLGSHFDTQVKLHEREIAVLEERLARVRREMAEQTSGREGFISSKFDQIMTAIRERPERGGEAPRGRGERRPDRPNAPDKKAPPG